MSEETELPSSQPKIADFCDLMPELNGGILNEMVSKALADAAIGVCYSGKPKAKGKVTLSFDITQIGTSHQVEIVHTIEQVIPTENGKTSEVHTTTTPMFVGPRGKLSINPIDQGDLFKKRERA